MLMIYKPLNDIFYPETYRNLGVMHIMYMFVFRLEKNIIVNSGTHNHAKFSTIHTHINTSG